jgi:hypothetical protein
MTPPIVPKIKKKTTRFAGLGFVVLGDGRGI